MFILRAYGIAAILWSDKIMCHTENRFLCTSQFIGAWNWTRDNVLPRRLKTVIPWSILLIKICYLNPFHLQEFHSVSFQTEPPASQAQYVGTPSVYASIGMELPSSLQWWPEWCPSVEIFLQQLLHHLDQLQFYMPKYCIGCSQVNHY